MKETDPIRRAYQYANLGKIKKARKILRDLVKEDQENEKAWLGLFHLSNSYDEKLDCLQKVLDINPDHQEALKQMASLTTRMKEREIEKSLLSIQKATSSNRFPRSILIIIFLLLILILGYGSGWLLYQLHTSQNTPEIIQSSLGNLQNLVIDYIRVNTQDSCLQFFIPVNATATVSPSITSTTDISLAQADHSDTPAPTMTSTPTATPFLTSSPTNTATSTQTSTFTLTFIPTLTFTPTITPSYTPTPTLTATSTFTPEPTITPTTSPSPAPGATQSSQILISDIEGHPQRLSLSCESRAAASWATYFGREIGELEFFNQLPVSDNPDKGFVGDVNGEWGQIPPNPYGVHAEPVAELLRKFGLDAQAVIDSTWQQLTTELSLGHPTIVWVVGHVEPGKAVLYTASDGCEVYVARYQHTVLLIGFDDEKQEVTILDGDQIYSRPYDTFQQSWKVLGNMAILFSPEPTPEETPVP